MQGVILAAGKGKRLEGLDPERSKAMMPALGKPLVGRVMDSFPRDLVGELLVVVNPLDRPLQNHLQTPDAWSGPIRIIQQENRLGMAHALGLAAPFLDGPFFLSACDSLIRAADWRALYAAQEFSEFGHAALAVQKQPASQARERSVLLLQNNQILEIVEKPERVPEPSAWTSLPHYYLPLDLLEHLAAVPKSVRGEYELQDLIQAFIDHGGIVQAVNVSERLQLTRAADLLEINIALFAEEHMSERPAPGTKGVVLVNPVLVEAGARVGRGVALGPNVFVERNATIGDGAVLTNSVILSGGVVGPGEKISGAVVGPGGQYKTDH